MFLFLTLQKKHFDLCQELINAPRVSNSKRKRLKSILSHYQREYVDTYTDKN